MLTFIINQYLLRLSRSTADACCDFAPLAQRDAAVDRRTMSAWWRAARQSLLKALRPRNRISLSGAML
jgi:hypothetical protein